MFRRDFGVSFLALFVLSIFQISEVFAQVQYAPRVEYPTGSGPSSVFASDLDGDSALDLAVTCGYDNTVSVYINSGDGTYMTKVDYSVGNRPQSVFATDLDGDGDNDLAVVNRLSDDLSILKNNGNGTFAPKLTYSTGGNPLFVTGARLDADTLIDLAVASFDDNAVSVLINQGDGNFGLRTDHPVGSGPYAVCAADLDGDSIPDLATANGTDNTVSVLLNDGNGGFPSRTDYNTGTNPRGVIAADLDGDGKRDLAVANWGSFSVSIFKNSGAGVFSPDNDFATGVHPTSLAAANLDGDTFPDLAVGSVAQDFSCNSAVIPVLINNGTGAFFTRVDLESIYDPHAIVVSELDADSLHEMITVHSLSSELVVTDFPDSVLPATCLAIPGDANANGRLGLDDIISILNFLYCGSGSGGADAQKCNGWPPCSFNSGMCWLSGLLCRGDWNGSCSVTLADIIMGVNFLFNKPGGPWDPLPVGPCCQPAP
ncbi:MAG: VCBS repeat-containing protein [candidate division Zixibacteria bacterium]|nr:VCBS repeat-containing protein [candidate division Zixibacteria bacterium]